MVFIMITGIQLRAAMGALGWSVAELQKKSQVGSTTITAMRNDDGVKDNITHGLLKKVRKAIDDGLAEKGYTIEARGGKEGEE